METKEQKAERLNALRQKLNTTGTKLAIVATPVIMSATAFAAEDNTINIGTLGLLGLTASAAAIFTIKASPSLMMWGYRKILGFIGR